MVAATQGQALPARGCREKVLAPQSGCCSCWNLQRFKGISSRYVHEDSACKRQRCCKRIL